MNTLRDRLWIWGHPAGSFNKGSYGIKGESKMTPVEGMEYLGAKNVFFVPMGRPIDRIEETERMRSVDEVGWSIELAATHPENVTEVCRLAKTYKNVKRGIFDDFFNDDNPWNNFHHYTPELLWQFRRELNAAGVELWLVLYTKQLHLDVDIRPYLAPFDGVSLWFWNEEDVENYDARLARFFELTPGQRRMIGCYLYDFGGEKPALPEPILDQLERDAALIRKGKLEGIILHTNCVADLGHPGVEAARAWIEKHGDEPVPPIVR